MTPSPSRAAPGCAPGLSVRGFTPPLRLADFKLIAFDMDSTLINIECVDEIADAAGRKAEVAAITEAAMRGEIADYKESLRQRVALLKGVPETALHGVYNERLRIEREAPEVKDRVQLVRDVLRSLGTPKERQAAPAVAEAVR